MKQEDKYKNIQGLTFLSVLKYVSNTLSGENIAVGLLAVSHGGSYFHVSQRKLRLIKKLNPEAGSLLNFSLTQLSKTLEADIEFGPQRKLMPIKFLTPQYLERLSVYNNGVLQFSSPQSFGFIFNEKDFSNFFSKYIGEEEELTVNRPKISAIKTSIQNKLYAPLKGKIDVDYTLRKSQLPSLYFDYHLDGIGVNGAVYAVKAIDINAQKTAGHVKAEISEFESIIERLNNLALSKGLSGDNKYHLVFEEYKGKVLSLLELSSILKKENMPFFTVNPIEDLDKITSEILRNKAKKFSEVLALGSDSIV